MLSFPFPYLHRRIRYTPATPTPIRTSTILGDPKTAAVTIADSDTAPTIRNVGGSPASFLLIYQSQTKNRSLQLTAGTETWYWPEIRWQQSTHITFSLDPVSPLPAPGQIPISLTSAQFTSRIHNPLSHGNAIFPFVLDPDAELVVSVTSIATEREWDLTVIRMVPDRATVPLVLPKRTWHDWGATQPASGGTLSTVNQSVKWGQIVPWIRLVVSGSISAALPTVLTAPSFRHQFPHVRWGLQLRRSQAHAPSPYSVTFRLVGSTSGTISTAVLTVPTDDSVIEWDTSIAFGGVAESYALWIDNTDNARFEFRIWTET